MPLVNEARKITRLHLAEMADLKKNAKNACYTVSGIVCLHNYTYMYT